MRRALAVAALLVAALAPSARAEVLTLDPTTATAHMLQVSDVTPALGLSGPLTRDIIEADRLAPVLCNQANQRFVIGPISKEKVAVDITQPDLSNVQQAVYDYGSARSARAAFARIVKRATQCVQRNALPSGGQGRVQILTSGAAPVQFRGVPGVWTREINVGPDGAVDYDAYAVNLLVGDTVQQVMLTLFNAGRAADVQRSSVDTLAVTLAKRWMRGTSGSQ